jgi:PEP-CTERM motif
MKNYLLRSVLSSLSLFALICGISSAAHAAPVRFEQVVQVVNAKPGKANSGGFSRLRLTNDDSVVSVADDDDDDQEKVPQKGERMISESSFDVVEADDCNCEQVTPQGGFPKWGILGIAAAGAIPVAILLIKRKKDDPTPTPSTPGQTPTPTTPTPTVTPTVTPTPTEPVPEPMTLLLFGTGLAGIGVAARRRLRKRGEDETED